jgi:hypothetical protein
MKLMEKFDRIIFGDNQFFGINHMSQEKAQQLSEKFYNFQAILDVYQMAIDSNIRGIMLNSNDRASEICDHFVSNKSKFPELNWYPSIPYPHKYANLISEKGIIPTINEILFKDNSAVGVLGTLMKGGSAVIGKDAIKLLQLLVDVEMKIFKNLNVRVVFLQNIITDLLLGYEVKDIFFEYCEYIRKKYDATPGLITQNMPRLKSKLEEWGINNVVICSSFNKIGYLMSPNVETYIESALKNDSSKYQIMAMSTLASGAIPPKEAFDFIKTQNIQSVVFGASSKDHIVHTVSLLK